MTRRLRDPFFVSMGVLGALVVTGLVSVALAWESLADSLVVATQLPYAVSGGLGGLALAGFGLGLIAIQARRRTEARQRDALARMTQVAASFLADVRAVSK